MSDVKEPTAKDVELLKLNKDFLKKQIEESKKAIQYARQSIAAFSEQVQQQTGILNYSQHLLDKFDIPEAPKEEPKKKTDLEVK